ncbi:putative endonuclease [Granulicella rosea]|uniref:UPF0102 protein SAMN05421770_10761 n=1 Tax=Granulicella rosea TaxID=474952 RepID=A0A239LL93_9BACT|nr:YraN family protein [Granulicella rosea]SNT30354.1 putative endonuclease [Granulicella rosea]
MAAAGTLGTLWLNTQRWGLLRLGAAADRLGRAPKLANHLATGLRGEFEALFYLRRQGYVVVARRWRSPELKGDLDLVAWEGETLCFIEVKARTAHDNIAAEVAVDREKADNLREMARAYLRRIAREERERIPVRFDVVSVYLLQGAAPEFTLFRDALGWR